jgi:hypothetical protein
MPAVTTLKILSFLFSESYLVINLETVMGVPEHERVSKNAKSESATW